MFVLHANYIGLFIAKITKSSLQVYKYVYFFIADDDAAAGKIQI